MSNVVVANKQEIATVRDTLEKMKPQFLAVLPKHVTPDRLCRVAMTCIQQTPKLLECTRQSLFAAIMRSAQLGLEPDGILGQAYLIPYGDNVQFIVGYKGLIDLARRSGEVTSILAKEVYENDEFEVAYHLDPPFHHKPKMNGDRGDVIAFWAMAKFKDGGSHWDWMTKSEVISIRDNSQGYKAALAWSKNAKNTRTKGQIISPWEQNFVEMGKKTMIRRIAKYLPMSVQKAAAFDDLQEAGKNPTIDEFGDITIDGSAETINTDAPQIEQQPKTSKLDALAGKKETPATPETPHDAETGEIIEAINFKDGQQVLTACKALSAKLAELPLEERGHAFVEGQGVELVEALKTLGFGQNKKQFTDLGIKLFD